jgi:hypothetical protein
MMPLHPPTTTSAPSSPAATAATPSTATQQQQQQQQNSGNGPKQQLNIVWAPAKCFSYFLCSFLLINFVLGPLTYINSIHSERPHAQTPYPMSHHCCEPFV